MEIFIGYLSQGLLLGAAAGILPGPVMMFSIAQVLKNDTWSGFKVQLGATLMDIVRILIVFSLFSFLPQNQYLIGSISFLGGVFLLYMASSNFNYQPKLDNSSSKISNPIYEGMMGNILNSAAYVFWLTVGGPIILTANQTGLYLSGFMFALGFLISITFIGGLVAFFAGSVRQYLASHYYIYIIRVLGVVIIFFAALSFNQAYQYFIK